MSYWMAYTPEDHVIWGLGLTQLDALRDASTHTSCKCLARRCSFELYWRVETEGGDVDWWALPNGVADCEKQNRGSP